MARRIATVRGVAIRPGVSKNGRLYTATNIGRAVERATARMADPTGRPLTMYTHHAGATDASRLVGRLTGLVLEKDGSVRFTGDIADTHHGRTIASLTDTEEGAPFLEGVSIRGRWIGQERPVRMPDGSIAMTADDLEIDGLDFTSRPGVDGARIEASTADPDAAEAFTGPGLIFESADLVLVEATKTPYGDVDYADPGYLPDRKKRYPLNNQRRTRAAWSYINQADNARQYTAQQLKRVKGRIKKALKRFGVTVTAETAPLVPLAEDATYEAVEECYGDSGAGFSLTARNGPITVNISAYDGIEPAELAVIAKAAMCAAVDALAAMDPDMDADIDVPGAPDADTDSSMETAQRPNDDQMESAPVAGQQLTAEQVAAVQAANFPPGTFVTPAVLAEALVSTAPTAPVGETTTPQEVPAVSEPQTPAVAEQAPATTPAPVAPVVQLTMEQFQQLLGRQASVAEAAPAAPAAPAPVVETEDQRITRIVEARLATERAQLEESLRAEVRQTGPVRRGLKSGGGTPDSVTEAAAAGDVAAQRQTFNDQLLSWVSNGRYNNYEA